VNFELGTSCKLAPAGGECCHILILIYIFLMNGKDINY